MARTETRIGWWSSIFDPFATAGAETTVLTGRSLRAVRWFMVLVFMAAIVVYTADLFAIWDEAHRVKFQGAVDRFGERETFNFFGLTVEERALLGEGADDVPGWYPVFVVARAATLHLAALGLAWLIHSRRPKHWMAYLTSLFILLGPWMGNLDEDRDRLDDSAVFEVSQALGSLALLVFLSFLWLFPDGRFRGSLIRLVTTVGGFVAALFIVRHVVDSIRPLSQDTKDFFDGIAFLTVLGAALFWFVMGVGVQVWRYQNTPIPNRRLARWNLAVLIAIPLWLMPFQALHDLFSDSDVGRYSISGFVWEQIHETVYVAAPAIFGFWILFLVRRQGWWDFQTLWNRTAIYGISLLGLALLYGVAFGLVTLAAIPLADDAERAVAVIAATAAVAFAYGPLLGRVRRWVDNRWFPRRAEVDELSRAFADRIRDTPTPAAVPDELRSMVQRELDPGHVELWTPARGEFR